VTAARVLRLIAGGALALLILAACIGLGWWQWTRASEKAITVAPDPPVPIAGILAPASTPTPADFLVRALVVDADATGTGSVATLPVIVGWHAAGDLVGPDPGPAHVSLTGYVRAAEEARPYDPLPTTSIPGAIWSTTVSPSALAQMWPAPLYSAVFVDYEGSASWRPLAPLPPQTHLNFRSGAYAFEWWAFGGFAVFIAGRWMRDNGRVESGEAKEEVS
jgi:cytochrome oxidase assembly protein ShyY1